MALIKCIECGASVSDQAQSCVKCGAPIEPSKQAESQQLGPPGLLRNLTLGAIVLFVAYQCASPTPERTASEQGPLGHSAALELCQRAIKLASKDPEKAQVPFVNGRQSAHELHFSWDHGGKMLRLRNGFGLEVAASGFCAVDTVGKRITALEIDGKKFDLGG